jgi:hypothetical protein
MEVPLYEQANATSVDDGTGVATATARIGPSRFGDMWKVVLMTSYSDSTTDVELRVYRNVESPGSMVDSTYAGRSATSSCEIWLKQGESLVAVWRKGDIGAHHSLRIEGTNYSQRQG